VEIDAMPRLTATEDTALRRAFALAGVRLDRAPAAYTSEWRRAAACEAVGGELSAPRRYAPSPRSTRGATRA
jgi:hypothetical protein